MHTVNVLFLFSSNPAEIKTPPEKRITMNRIFFLSVRINKETVSTAGLRCLVKNSISHNQGGKYSQITQREVRILFLGLF